jgi:hypothetical protein
MQTDKAIEIPYSKTKIFFLLLASIGVVTVGIWFLISPPQIDNSYFNDPKRITITGYICIFFFGYGIFKISKQFFNNSPQLIIDNGGLTNNMKSAAAKYIAWADVEKAEIVSLRRQSFIIIHVKNPEEYINSQTSFLKRKSMQLDHKLFGGPISMSTVGLKISLNKLLDIINEKIK